MPGAEGVPQIINSSFQARDEESGVQSRRVGIAGSLRVSLR